MREMEREGQSIGYLFNYAMGPTPNNATLKLSSLVTNIRGKDL